MKISNMKLTQLSTSEFKLDCVGDFCLNSNGNCIVLLGSSSEVTILELMNNCDTMILMPYNNKQFSICQDKPISEIIRDINLVKIYESATVQESQELALDLIYTAECSVEPHRARVIQVDSVTLKNNILSCVLTTYGYCDIYQKVPITEEWKPLNTNLTNILIKDIFPSKDLATHIQNLNDLKTYVDKFIITCFALTVKSTDLIIYLGTAAGFVVSVKYNETTQKFEEICHMKTSLNRISYITTCNNFILVACDQGTVRLLKINYESNNLEELEYLWSKSDRMSCRKAFFMYNEILKSYIIVFCKTAHILAYRLDTEGAVLSSSTLYVSGIKITGIETISDTEFMITTITAAVKYIKITCPTKEELNIEEQIVEHEFDSNNYQILGVATSKSKNLWSFLLYRNKDYVHQSKNTASTAFLNVCKLSSHDSFIKLINLNLDCMNKAQDLIMAINLDIFNNQDTEKYINYLDLNKLSFPPQLNDAFIQKLQIKLIISRKMAAFQKIKFRKVKVLTQNELKILEPGLQLVHIISRLRYLKQLKSKSVQLTKFQEHAITCMQIKFNNLLNDLIATNSKDEENQLQKVGDKFSLVIVVEFENYKFDTDNFTKQTEYCIMCNQAITSFSKCPEEHEIKRCTISYTQLTLFQTKHCPHCFALARNDEDGNLQELYSTDEYVTCIYCRFLLKHDDY